ncbi:MAG: YlbF family regulator [Clostridia bacterium]
MAELLELANQLGEAITKEEKFINYQDLKNKQMADETLQQLIAEFNLRRLNFTKESEKQDADKELVEKLHASVDEIYAQIMENETMKALDNAANEFEALINSVFTTINFHITGEEEHGCSSSDCSSCSGCH